jgi:homocysteine S-methyltransferase
MAASNLKAEERSPASAAGSVLDRLFASGRAMLCDGAMGTMLQARGIAIDRCCDEVNLAQPEMVASVHAEYLRAGAEIVETNTFGANEFRLQRYGLGDRVREINCAGVRIARRCAREAGAEAYVAGAVGPLGVSLDGKTDLDRGRAAFAEQIVALTEGGPGVGADLLMIETMTSLEEAGEAIRAAREAAPGLRLVAMVTVGEDGNCLDGAPPEEVAARLTEWSADAVGCNCSSGPATVLRAMERMRRATHLPLAAMPNAGLPKFEDGRAIYAVSPEEMAGFARRAIEAGASLIGGCCGTTPEHTWAMKSALRDVSFGKWL